MRGSELQLRIATDVNYRRNSLKMTCLIVIGSSRQPPPANTAKNAFVERPPLGARGRRKRGGVDAPVLGAFFQNHADSGSSF